MCSGETTAPSPPLGAGGTPSSSDFREASCPVSPSLPPLGAMGSGRRYILEKNVPSQRAAMWRESVRSRRKVSAARGKCLHDTKTRACGSRLSPSGNPAHDSDQLSAIGSIGVRIRLSSRLQSRHELHPHWS